MPEIYVPLEGWKRIESLAVSFKMDEASNNEKGDREYIYGLAQNMWGTEKLLTHVIGVCNANRDKKRIQKTLSLSNWRKISWM